MDPLGSLIDWISVYGLVGLIGIGLAERFLPALPSHGALVAIGIAVIDGAWCLSVAIIATTAGSSAGALVLYFLLRSLGITRLNSFLRTIRRYLRIPPIRTGRMQSHFHTRQRSFAFVSQMIPTVRLVTPLIAGLHRVKFSSFAAGTIFGVALWNSFFVLIGSFAARLTPDVNASALAIGLLACLVVAEAFITLYFRLFSIRDRSKRGEKANRGFVDLPKLVVPDSTIEPASEISNF